ncbi:DUF805 domain-containing protein [Flavobacterium sp. NRK1]|uniref:DUF805 domain-containing protein n=1 Tax=Flavobacterium sp. NRK1 TaxID=2954929 RepID=UPI0020935545|nr:DUF805 domain-containing protein [Flavobacterium sp. NRK1]MCO6147797.1 DUF805 domain-containing protein [Flavobacterium sp. NRK1]
MINWYLKVVRDNYANFYGRARRSEYWYYTLCGTIISLLLRVIDYAIGLDFNIMGTLYSLVVLIPGLAVTVRRMHDIGKSGWYVVYFMIPTFIAGFWFGFSIVSGGNSGFSGWIIIPLLLLIIPSIWMLVLLCREGDSDPNEYGPDPKKPYSEIEEIGTVQDV